MDPNEVYAEMVRLATSIVDAVGAGAHFDDDDVADLAERVERLDAWLSNGGFLPAAWERAA